MSDAVVALLAVQVGLSVILVIGLFVIGRSAIRSLNSATSLLQNVQSMIEVEVKPTSRDVRATLVKAEETAAMANRTLTAAEPAVSAIGSFIGRASKKASPLWLDAAKLSFGIVKAIRNGRQNNKGELANVR